MSDQSIASIARTLAALLTAAAQRQTENDERKRIDELNAKLCAEYRAELLEALRVSA
ncbi:hypothetical protein I6F35_06520 [Bradyrhizobium sp. BRP22]|uniref:hypothetical protein n=1 Tax=Bradyrhizobium sp. BRP22 TaxID=2793821 RepID=UPI001CD295DF|nr:hypothetical protein [Bradyrhizobium sp. BRP22]MCA1452875.1 hypothetical protein [Bradyrhizobium sp. BRP22]